MLIKGKTATGFEFEVDERILSDFRFIDAMAGASQDEDYSKFFQSLSKLSPLIFGVDGDKKLMKHIQDLNDGYVPVEKVISEFKDVIECINSSKNKDLKN